MSGFEERERAFEKGFELEEELHFKIMSQAIRLFAAWAAMELGLKDNAAQSYIEVCADLGMGKAGYQDVVVKSEKDFRAKGIPLSHHRLEKEMEGFYETARRAIREGEAR
jgi:hypothetical protein